MPDIQKSYFDELVAAGRGVVALIMGDRKAAQQTLQELISKYPSSSAAASAKQRLAAFKR